MSTYESEILTEDQIHEMSGTEDGRKELRDYLSTMGNQQASEIRRIGAALNILGLTEAAAILFNAATYQRIPSMIHQVLTSHELTSQIRHNSQMMVGLLGVALKDSDPELAKSLVDRAARLTENIS